MKKVIAGSRESELAVIQTRIVTDYIESHNPGMKTEILKIKTSGDRIQDRKLEEIGGKGLFIKELDEALRNGESDFSVHSLKDMTMSVPTDLPILGFSEREDARDVLVLPQGMTEIDFSKPFGCSSSRRILQLEKLYPGVKTASIRGNILTRLKKLDSGGYGALVLAAAGLIRLGLADRISRYFSLDEMIPSAGQGILCVQGKAGIDYSYLSGFFSDKSAAEATAERSFVRYLNGECTSPIAAYAWICDGRMHLRGLYFDADTKKSVTGTICGPAENASLIGIQLAECLKNADRDLTEEMKFSAGKVWLVGAGPSDPGLMTVRGSGVLSRADTVVFDSLVGTEILNMIPETAEKIDVGKRAGCHKKSQTQINEILLEKAASGKKVVRLKGGDPFLFGRGGEELELLHANGIPFEIVPGVTSAIAVPAYNGIPVTHRDYASSVHIITGHKRDDRESDINFEALVQTGGTLVFLMGAASLEDIMTGLLRAGMRPDMPAAVLEKGTGACQKRIAADIRTLSEKAGEQGIETPAIIVVGEVCQLADDFAWYEKMPLFGEKIIVTRPRERNSYLTERLRDLGAEVISLPSAETLPVHDPAELADIAKALSVIEDYDFLVFTSPYGAVRFFDLLKENGVDIRKIGKARLAAIGKATAKEITERGMTVSIMPEEYDGGSLGRKIAASLKGGERILIPRAASGSRELTDEIKKVSGVTVTDLPIYETKIPEIPSFTEEQLADGHVTMVMFTSASCVRGFKAVLPDFDCSEFTAVCIGRRTAEEAEKYHMKTVAAAHATMDEMIKCALQVHGSRQQDKS